MNDIERGGRGQGIPAPPKSVLFACSTFPRWPDDELPDFVWLQILHLRRILPGTETFLLAPHHPGAKVREVREGVRIRRFRYAFPSSAQKLAYPAIWPNIQQNPLLLFQVPLFLFSEFLATYRWLKEEEVSVVYSHWFMPQGVACGFAAWLTGTPHVFTSHSQDVAVLGKLPILGRWLVSFLASRAEAITVVSEASKTALMNMLSSKKWNQLRPRVSVIPMGVDLDQWQATLRSASYPHTPWLQRAHRLLFVGRLAEKKGVEFLLEALSTDFLDEMAPGLAVAGTGPLRTYLESRSVHLGLDDQVHFVGYVRGETKAGYFKAADVVVIPSIVTAGGDAEGLPVVLLEALAAGKICVATDASNAQEIVTSGEDGFIVPAGDSAALGKTIAQALSLSSTERRDMAERAQEMAQEFAWERIAKRHAVHLFGGL